jgi:hypothetical protein
MFEKLARRAESVATDLGGTRRRFLGRAGRGALVAAGALGAMLAAPTRARAGNGCHHGHCYKDCVATCGGDANCMSSCYFTCCVLTF